MALRRPPRLPYLFAAVTFSLTLVSAAFAPAMAGAAPKATSHTAPGQAPSASNGVNHNDTPPAGNPSCSTSPGTSGTCSTPQPSSNADSNNTGANSTSTTNPYRSTRNGAPSDNGSGTGQATGRPCAGCVGQADNKNPPGQASSGPSDHNNGYECDGNNGIGQTNPAHTGCTTPPTTGGGCTPTSANTCGGGGPCTPTDANHNCTTPGDQCTPTAEASGSGVCSTGGTTGGSTVGGTSCTEGTPGCTSLACSVTATGEAMGPQGCATTTVLALDGSRVPTGVLAPEGSRAPTDLLATSMLPASSLAAQGAAGATAVQAPTPTVVAAAGGSKTLPFTGVDIETLLFLAAGLAVAGGGITALGRRRQSSVA